MRAPLPALSASDWRAQLPYWFGARAAAGFFLFPPATHDPHILRYLLDLRDFLARYPAPRLDPEAHKALLDALRHSATAKRALRDLGYPIAPPRDAALAALTAQAPALERDLLALQATLCDRLRASVAEAEAALREACAGVALGTAPRHTPTRVLVTVDDAARGAIGAHLAPSFQAHLYPDRPDLDPDAIAGFVQRALLRLRRMFLPSACAAPNPHTIASLTVTHAFDLRARLPNNDARFTRARVDLAARIAWCHDGPTPTLRLDLDTHTEALLAALGTRSEPLDFNALMSGLRDLAYDAPPARTHPDAPPSTQRTVAASDGRLLGLLTRWDAPRLPQTATDYIAAWFDRAPAWRAWAAARLGLHRPNLRDAPLLRALQHAPGTARFLGDLQAKLRSLAASECEAIRTHALHTLASAHPDVLGADALAQALTVEATHDGSTLPLQLSSERRVWLARAEGRALPARSARAVAFACAAPPPESALRLDRALPELTATWTVRTDDGASCDVRADHTPHFAPERLNRRVLTR